MPSRWQHWSFPTLVLLTRSPTSNYPQTRHHYENPELGGWSWSTPLDHREGGGPHQKERGAATLWLCLPSSRQQEGPSGPVVYPVGKKREPKVDIQLSQHHTTFPGRPNWSCLTWIWGNLQRLNHWASDRNLEEAGLTATVTQILVDLLPMAVALEQKSHAGALPFRN